MTTEYLLHEQLEHVLAALTPANELVCRALLATGLRISDVLTLKPEQIKRNVWVTEAKTGKSKQVGFSAELRDAILAQSSAAWAFPSPKDPAKHRTRQAVWADIKRAAAAFRLPQNVAPHSLRKVYAVELRNKYGDIERVQKALNHDRQATTMLYAMADHLLTTKPRRWKRRRPVKKDLTEIGGGCKMLPCITELDGCESTPGPESTLQSEELEPLPVLPRAWEDGYRSADRFYPSHETPDPEGWDYDPNEGVRLVW